MEPSDRQELQNTSTALDAAVHAILDELAFMKATLDILLNHLGADRKLFFRRLEREMPKRYFAHRGEVQERFRERFRRALPKTRPPA